VSVRQIWKAEFEEDIDRIHLLGGEVGVLASSGSEAHFLDEAGLKRWTVTLRGEVVGFGFSSHDNTFFIAYKDGIRMVNRIGVTIKEVPLDSAPVGFSVSEIAVAVGEEGLLAFSRDGRELWKSDSGGSCVAAFRRRLFVGNGRHLVAYSSAGERTAEAELSEDIIALAPGRESLFVLLPHHLLSVAEDCEVVADKSLADTAVDLSADEYAAILLPHRVVLYDEGGQDRWLLSEKAADISTEGKGVAVAVGGRLSYYEEVGEKDVLYEIMCRGERRCGTFVSSSYVRKCPKCRSSKITMRVVRKDID
jgi:hypothetical protein